MAYIHFILQGKGGVGKSLIAALLVQYQVEHQKNPIAVDTDPVNASLASYSAFSTQRIELLDHDKALQPRRFDDLMEVIMENESQDIIIDNGASSFIPLSSYLIENRILELLETMKRKVVVHSVITGGQAQDDTLHGLMSVAKNMDVPLVIWINEYFGEITFAGKSFEEMKVYQDNHDKIVAMIRIKKRPTLFESDFAKMLQQRLTFVEALNDERFTFMEKNRLHMIRDNLYEQIREMHTRLDMREGEVVDDFA